MRFARADGLDGAALIAIEGDEVFEVDGGAELSELLRRGVDPHDLITDRVLPISPEGLSLACPIQPGKIVAIGLNYDDHIREARMDRPERPLIFAKFPSSVIGPGEAIVIDERITRRVDWEVELAVVIGRRMRHAAAADALEAVFGYTVANDVSARDIQFADGQWVRAKSLDTFCPLGPTIVTPDAIGDVQDLCLRTRVNGELLQDSSTREMVFGVTELLVFCSAAFTLEPGDVLLTGTPWGCGEFMTPRRCMRPGDVVETEIDRIGCLRNPVIAG